MTRLVIFWKLHKFIIFLFSILPESFIIEFWKLASNIELKVDNLVSCEFERIKLWKSNFQCLLKFRVSKWNSVDSISPKCEIWSERVSDFRFKVFFRIWGPNSKIYFWVDFVKYSGFGCLDQNFESSIDFRGWF